MRDFFLRYADCYSHFRLLDDILLVFSRLQRNTERLRDLPNGDPFVDSYDGVKVNWVNFVVELPIVMPLVYLFTSGMAHGGRPIGVPRQKSLKWLNGSCAKKATAIRREYRLFFVSSVFHWCRTLRCKIGGEAVEIVKRLYCLEADRTCWLAYIFKRGKADV